MSSRPLNYLKSATSTFSYAIRPYRWKYYLMIALSISGNVLSYSLPYFLKLIVDKVEIANAADHIITLSELRFPLSAIIFILVMQEVCFRFGHMIEVGIVPDMYKYITASLYESLIKRPTSYFENKFSGDLGRRIEQVGNACKYFVQDLPWESAWILLSLIITGFILFFTHIQIFLVFLGWIVFFFATGIPLLIWSYRASEKVAESQAVLSGTIIDTLSNISLVQSFGTTSFEQIQNEKALDEVVKIDRKMRWIDLINKFQNGLSFAILGISLVVTSIMLFTKNQFSLGDFAVVIATIPTVTGVVWNFGNMATRITKNFGELSDAVASLREKQEWLEGGAISKIAASDYSVQFKDVHFQYKGTANAVFEKFNLEIKQGEKVGVVGASGVGKSTLIKLLLRQHEFNAGDILIGGVRIQDFTLDTFHQLVSYVPQDTSLFHRTLFENIKYAKSTATDEEVYEATKKAQANLFIESFPEKYQTTVGERGVKLSGGQRQRIALARAILKNAPILILDEATSSLDTESESSIQEALSELFKEHTVIAIAHRLSTLRAMDRIIVIENGLVVESGAPQDLLKKKGSIFKKIWEHQKDGFITE